MFAARDILAVAALFAVAAVQTAAAAEKFKVVTTFTIIADMARNVAGDAAIVESITKPGAEIYGYQPTPGDLIRPAKRSSSFGTTSISSSGSRSSFAGSTASRTSSSRLG